MKAMASFVTEAMFVAWASDAPANPRQMPRGRYNDGLYLAFRPPVLLSEVQSLKVKNGMGENILRNLTTLVAKK